tara:strand:- start:691 stop:1167 length:477 start_codon:yes stop_codon:yes gene_type:complete
MSLKFFLILVLIFFIGCSTTPVKYDKPVKVDDYKHFVRLKEEKDDPVSKKTFSQKLKEVFTKQPKVKEAKTNKVEVKKSVPPKRRVRKTNTTSVTNSPGKLMAMSPRPESESSRDTGKTVMLYLIYLQALIIAIFAYVILRRQKRNKKLSVEKRELNL